MDEHSFRDKLIAPTIENAAKNTEFYRQHYADIDTSSIRRVADLACLPLVDKEMVRAAGGRIRSSQVSTRYVQNTAGSTGRALQLHRSQEELQFIDDFFREVLNLGEEDDNSLYTPNIVLALQDIHHGTPTSIPTQDFILNAAVKDDILLAQTVAMLGETFDFGTVRTKINRLTGPASQILLLTAHVSENGLEDVAAEIESVCCTSRYLTDRQRRFLEETWGATVIDRYSVSEIFGGATRCQLCGHFHFDLHVVPELVDLTGKTIGEGETGELALTSLFPFSQRTPLVRYLTGDMFEWVSTNCSQRAYSFLGRKCGALFANRAQGPLLLAESAIVETLDAFPQLARTRHYTDLLSIRDHTVCGRVKARCAVSTDQDRLNITIAVETVVNPRSFSAEATRLEQQILEEILRRSPLLKQSVLEGQTVISLNLCPPRALNLDALPSSTLAKSSVSWHAMAGV